MPAAPPSTSPADGRYALQMNAPSQTTPSHRPRQRGSNTPPATPHPAWPPTSATSVDRSRTTGMPVGYLLVTMGHIQQARLIEIVADQLQTNRQSANKTARNRHTGQSGEIHCDRIDIGQVHLDRIGRLFTQLEGRRRGCRAQNDFTLLEGFDKIIGNQTADTLSLQI